MASQITSLTVVHSTVYSDVDRRKHWSSASLAFVWGIHRDRWIPRTKGLLRGKCFHLMTSSCTSVLLFMMASVWNNTTLTLKKMLLPPMKISALIRCSPSQQSCQTYCIVFIKRSAKKLERLMDAIMLINVWSDVICQCSHVIWCSIVVR